MTMRCPECNIDMIDEHTAYMVANSMCRVCKMKKQNDIADDWDRRFFSYDQMMFEYRKIKKDNVVMKDGIKYDLNDLWRGDS